MTAEQNRGPNRVLGLDAVGLKLVAHDRSPRLAFGRHADQDERPGPLGRARGKREGRHAAHGEPEKVERTEPEGVGEGLDVIDQRLGVEPAGGHIPTRRGMAARIREVDGEGRGELSTQRREIVAPGTRRAVESDQRRPGTRHFVADVQSVGPDVRHGGDATARARPKDVWESPVPPICATERRIVRPMTMNQREGVAIVTIAGAGRTAESSPLVLAIYDAHHRELATFIGGIERDPRTAEDVLSETFLRLIEEVRRGRVPDQPRAWLYRVAANLVIDGGRRRAVVSRTLGRLVDHRTEPPPDDAIIRGETRREVWAALGTLPVDARTALMLAAHGFSGREVAAALGRSELATRSLICRARLRLREEVSGIEVRS